MPPVFARWIAAQGHEAEHVGDCGLGRAADAAIWEYATRFDAVIVTKDEDFAQRKVIEGNGPKVAWIRLSNTRRSELLTWFEKMLPRLLEALDRGEVLIEIL